MLETRPLPGITATTLCDRGDTAHLMLGMWHNADFDLEPLISNLLLVMHQ